MLGLEVEFEFSEVYSKLKNFSPKKNTKAATPKPPINMESSLFETCYVCSVKFI